MANRIRGIATAFCTAAAASDQPTIGQTLQASSACGAKVLQAVVLWSGQQFKEQRAFSSAQSWRPQSV